jgi:hypothetical protein
LRWNSQSAQSGDQSRRVNRRGSEISAGGSTEVRATLVNNDYHYTPYTGAADVTFVSNCAQSGQATLASPVALTNGGAESTYTAKGCVGSDLITATATINGHQFTATGTVNVASAEVGSIQFLSADPTVVSFKDSGLPDTSNVTFQVLDKAGHPVAGKVVDFALSTSVGGITLAESSAKTAVNGKVQAIVHAGTVHTPVRVKATVEHTSSPISSQSSQLAISTGIVDADSFSISANELNPGGYDQDGVTDAVTVRLADRFNNPVPDGTAVTFRTEGGSITPQCTTIGGACQVTWTSQAPRPIHGRVSILAYAIGEESFVDKDGDGRFNHDDTFTDLGEPYEDDDEDGQYNASKVEPFADYNKDGRRNGPDGGYEGLQCEKQCGPAGAIPPGNLTTDVGAQLVLVMSGSNAKISTSAVCGPSSAPPTKPIGLSAGIPEFKLFVKDQNCQTMPHNTSISLQASGGVKIDSKTSFKVENTNAKTVLPYLVLLENASAGAMITVTVTAPNGNITTEYIKFQ